MGTFKDRENYLKQLCIDHPLVQHTVDVGGKVRNSFFRLNEEDELTAATINNIDYPCVCNILMNGRISDTSNALADIRQIFSNGWLFLDHVSNPDGNGILPDAVQNVYDITFGIMEDFIKAMKDDLQENGSCGAFANLDLNKMNWRAVGPMENNEYGWILYFDNEQKATRIL